MSESTTVQATRSRSTRSSRRNAPTRAAARRSYSSMGCGCCRAAGSLGRGPSRKRGMRRSRRAGLTTPRRWQRRTPTSGDGERDHRTSGRPICSNHRGAPPRAGHRRALIRGACWRGSWRTGGLRRSPSLSRRPPSVGSCRSRSRPSRRLGPSSTPCQPPPRRPAHVLAVPLRVREHGRRGRGNRSLP